MAVINNLSASLVSFKVNDVSKSFLNSGGTYNTPDLLNGGETYGEGTLNILSYAFRIQGLQGHTIKEIIVSSLLLTPTGELSNGARFSQSFDGILITDIISGNNTTKVISNTKFNLNKQIDSASYDFLYEVLGRETTNYLYCLKSITLVFSDIQYKVYISFNGPLNGRAASVISVSYLLQNLGSVDVTFSKDPTSKFDSNIDSVEGRLYLKQDGIFVDGYQYSTTQKATSNKLGLVTIKDLFDTDESGTAIAPTDSGVATSSLLAYSIYLEAVKLATNEDVGRVKLQDTFEIDEDREIIAPTEGGVAASPLLVYNALVSAINYTDEVIAPISDQIIEIQATLNGINAPLAMNIENDNHELEGLGGTLTFSNDFEKIDNKLYIKWIEI